MIRCAPSLADVVQQGRGAELGIAGLRAGDLEDLERMVEGVTLGVMHRVLAHSVQIQQEVA